MASRTLTNGSRRCSYKTELRLVRDFSQAVVACSSPVACLKVIHEFDFQSGRTDVVGIDSESFVHAFEAKLTKWRAALDQARRNGSFAHFAYVVLPVEAKIAALRGKALFEKLGVGLIILHEKIAKLEIPPTKCDPLLPWLTSKAVGQLSDNERAHSYSSRKRACGSTRL